ncbi:hypothetical protein K438DRAFT_1783748 [Mycena galopus ATCC 62051]|nr:hypothetical protein K438DRAFT_1783748 [Mycena galopus ATCC 62051]
MSATATLAPSVFTTPMLTPSTPTRPGAQTPQLHEAALICLHPGGRLGVKDRGRADTWDGHHGHGHYQHVHGGMGVRKGKGNGKGTGMAAVTRREKEQALEAEVLKVLEAIQLNMEAGRASLAPAFGAGDHHPPPP